MGDFITADEGFDQIAKAACFQVFNRIFQRIGIEIAHNQHIRVRIEIGIGRDPVRQQIAHLNTGVVVASLSVILILICTGSAAASLGFEVVADDIEALTADRVFEKLRQ